MRALCTLLACFLFAASVHAQIINSDGDNLYDGKASFKGDYGVDAGEASAAMGGSKSAQPPGYRSAWEDCGGAGASATDRLRSIAATIKGFAKQVKFVRNAAQDCGHVDSSGLHPGPGTKIVYPGPSVFKAATDGRATAQTALEKYGTKAVFLSVRQPIINSDGDNLYDGKASFKGDYGVDAGEASTAMGGSKSAQPPGYRSAWEDCGGAGASATDRLRAIAATIKGFAKQVKFVRNAAQDCGHVDSSGLHPGPGVKVVYPGPSVFKAATDGRATAQTALEKYGTKAAFLNVRQPIINSDGDNLYDGKASFKGDYGVDAGEASTAMGGSKSAQPPGYRSAWEDCGGAGASATDRLRAIAATIKGFAKQVKFVRNAAQDCGHVDSSGLHPGPGVKVVYPGPSVFKAATDGRATAQDALKKYGTKA
jgi:ABC-type transporter Mla MlaB component